MPKTAPCYYTTFALFVHVFAEIRNIQTQKSLIFQHFMGFATNRVFDFPFYIYFILIYLIHFFASVE